MSHSTSSSSSTIGDTSRPSGTGSSFNDTLNVINLVALPLGFASIRYKWPRPVKRILVGTHWVSTVYLFHAHGPTLERNHPTSLTYVFMALLTPLKNTQMILFPNSTKYNDKKSTAITKTSDTTTTDERDSTTVSKFQSWLVEPTISLAKDAASFMGPFVWYMFPLQRRQRRRYRIDAPALTTDCKEANDGLIEQESWTTVLIRSLECLGCFAIKTVVGPILREYLLSNSSQSSTGSETSVRYYLSYLLSITCVAPQLDLVAAGIILMTRGRYELLSFFNYPWLSESTTEFWGRRWNRIVHVMLKDCVYVPMKTCGYASQLASLGAFGGSAVLHIAMAHYVHEAPTHQVLASGGIFVGFWALGRVELWIRTNYWPPKWRDSKQYRLLRIAATMTTFASTLPLLVHVFPKETILEMVINAPIDPPPVWARPIIAAFQDALLLQTSERGNGNGPLLWNEL